MSRENERDGDASLADTYVPPTLTLVGNLHQLLASGGSKDADQGACFPGTGTDVDPSCAN